MKKIMTTALAILAIVFTALAQTNTDEQAIRKLINDYDQAVTKNDTAFFEHTLSDDYTLTGPYGEVETKADAIKWLQNPNYTEISNKSDNIQVRIAGNMAFVTADWTTTRVKKDDKLAVPHTDTGRFTAIFEKRGGRWLIIAEHVSEKGHDRKEMEQQVLKAGTGYIQMVKNRDVAAIDRILADDFIYTNERGKVKNKAEDLASYKDDEVKFESIEVTDQKVRVINNTTAVETGTVHYKGTKSGKSFAGAERFTTTWIWRSQRWQIMADHVSTVAK